MPSLTSKRHHKAAKLVLVAAALLLTGGLYALVAPSTSVAAPNTEETVARGQALFAVSCASCHGLNGEGMGSEGHGGQGAPSLVGVGAAAVDFQMRTGRMPMANPLAQAPNRTNTFTTEEINSIALYVASLGDGPAIPKPEQYDIAGLSPEEVATGGDLFRTNCSACHNFQGSGGALPNGRVAPPLLDSKPIDIYEAMRTGPGEMPVFADGAIPDEDLRAMIAYLDQVHAEPSAGLTLGGLGPVSEGFWGWVAGIGGLMLFAMWITKKAARK
ncbi:MAG: cytochrome c [Propionicimonas sp.]